MTSRTQYIDFPIPGEEGERRTLVTFEDYESTDLPTATDLGCGRVTTRDPRQDWQRWDLQFAGVNVRYNGAYSDVTREMRCLRVESTGPYTAYLCQVKENYAIQDLLVRSRIMDVASYPEFLMIDNAPVPSTICSGGYIDSYVSTFEWRGNQGIMFGAPRAHVLVLQYPVRGSRVFSRRFDPPVRGRAFVTFEITVPATVPPPAITAPATVPPPAILPPVPPPPIVPSSAAPEDVVSTQHGTSIRVEFTAESDLPTPQFLYENSQFRDPTSGPSPANPTLGMFGFSEEMLDNDFFSISFRHDAANSHLRITDSDGHPVLTNDRVFALSINALPDRLTRLLGSPMFYIRDLAGAMLRSRDIGLFVSQFPGGWCGDTTGDNSGWMIGSPLRHILILRYPVRGVRVFARQIPSEFLMPDDPDDEAIGLVGPDMSSRFHHIPRPPRDTLPRESQYFGVPDDEEFSVDDDSDDESDASDDSSRSRDMSYVNPSYDPNRSPTWSPLRPRHEDEEIDESDADDLSSSPAPTVRSRGFVRPRGDSYGMIGKRPRNDWEAVPPTRAHSYRRTE